MTKIIATSKERLIKYLDYKGITYVDFFKGSGIKRGFLDSDKLNATISDVFLAKIIAFLPYLNLRWLISGDGSMEILDNQVNEQRSVYKRITDRLIDDRQAIPVYNIEATLGMTAVFKNLSDSKPLDYLYVPNAPKCDGAIYSNGDSMYPLIKSGDLVAYKMISDFHNDIFWGEMYVLGIDMGGDEYITVKFIQKSDLGPEWIKLVSQNKHHQDKDVLISKVRAMALVKVVIRYAVSV